MALIFYIFGQLVHPACRCRAIGREISGDDECFHGEVLSFVGSIIFSENKNTINVSEGNIFLYLIAI